MQKPFEHLAGGLPWTSGLNGFSQGAALAVRDAKGKLVCWLEATGPFMERAVRPSISEDDYQRAAYIAHAANAYPKLVEALQHFVEAHEREVWISRGKALDLLKSIGEKPAEFQGC